MKKSIYFLMMFIGLALTGCEPMEDIHEDIDDSIDNSPVLGVVDYTLTEDDYLDEDEGLGLNFPNFNSVEDARTMIPLLLSMKYPVWGEGSLVNVTFDLYAPIDIEEYTLTASDYEAVGLEQNYFSSFSQIQDFLELQYPQAEEGSYVELTYQTLAEEIMYNFNDEDFDLVGEELAATYPDPAESAANYGNFDRREGNDAYWSNEMILEAINVVLQENLDGVEGQTYNVSYEIYDGGSGSENMTVKFDGNAYVAVGGTGYTFEDSDYDLVGSELGETYPGPAGNAARFGSFDVRESSDNYWSDEMLLEAINIVLKEQFPAAEEGAKFDVEFDIYNGSVNPQINSVVLSGDSYVYDDEAVVSTIEETKVFALTNGDWNVPFSLESEDYTEMGQNFPNFSDEDEAMYKIAIFLEREFPYAEEGDFIAVAYDFYDGEGTSTRYANFIFEDGSWNHIPAVIEQTLQFGHTGAGWEPDNTIRYSLSPADYAFIADELASEYELAAANLADYGNFNRAGGPTSWDDSMMLEAMKILLQNIAPNAEVGQKYVLSYTAYVGSGYATQEMSFIKAEDGEWVLNN